MDERSEQRQMRRNLGFSLLSLGILLLLTLSGCGGRKLGTEDNPIVFSFVLASNADEIATLSEQFAGSLSQETGLVIRASASSDYAAVRDDLRTGRAHLAWLDAPNYLLARQQDGVDAALVANRVGAISYQGQFVARADRGIGSLADLRGAVMCWVDTSSASGYAIPRITLLANGIDPDADLGGSVRAYSHSNVIMYVYNGDCDAGATSVDARDLVLAERPDVKEVVTVLATTPSVPNDSISFVSDFPEDLREQIVDGLVNLAGTEEGRAALQALFGVDGLQRADDSIYAGLRAELSQAGVDIEDLAR
jgi:phosphonate transport system substrate-binding protein